MIFPVSYFFESLLLLWVKVTLVLPIAFYKMLSHDAPKPLFSGIFANTPTYFRLWQQACTLCHLTLRLPSAIGTHWPSQLAIIVITGHTTVSPQMHCQLEVALPFPYLLLWMWPCLSFWLWSVKSLSISDLFWLTLLDVLLTFMSAVVFESNPSISLVAPLLSWCLSDSAMPISLCYCSLTRSIRFSSILFLQLFSLCTTSVRFTSNGPCHCC